MTNLIRASKVIVIATVAMWLIPKLFFNKVRPGEIGVRLDAQTRRVGVRADDPPGRGTDSSAPPGDQGSVAGDEPAVRAGVPRLRLVERAEPGRAEAGGGRRHGVPRRRGGVEVGAQVGGRVVGPPVVGEHRVHRWTR